MTSRKILHEYLGMNKRSASRFSQAYSQQNRRGVSQKTLDALKQNYDVIFENYHWQWNFGTSLRSSNAIRVNAKDLCHRKNTRKPRYSTRKLIEAVFLSLPGDSVDSCTWIINHGVYKMTIKAKRTWRKPYCCVMIAGCINLKNSTSHPGYGC